mmetsp:Transcript_48939/g.76363  ORF Transcript_48939/g.76363 Transcript_48939/m.76363 type:complete len:132 (+) Transcript_48939:2679-3074(+)
MMLFVNFSPVSTDFIKKSLVNNKNTYGTIPNKGVKKLPKYLMTKENIAENSIEKEKEPVEEPNTFDESKGNPFAFFFEVIEETKMIEWPTANRLFKQFVIVVISLVISAFLIYSIDGVFASLSKSLFEGKN